MRRIVVVLIASAVLASQAEAQQAKEVEVINQPLAVELGNVDPLAVEVTNEPVAVEVVNPPAAPPPVRWQLVGFTTAAYTGDLGGP